MGEVEVFEVIRVEIGLYGEVDLNVVMMLGEF